jgi:oligopeptide transport system substrate-binding protein
MGGRHSSRRVLLPLVAILLAAFVLPVALAACGGSTGGAAGSSGPTPTQGGTYDYPLASDPGFDPSITQSGDGGLAVLHEVYEGLARWEPQPDGTMKTVPCLAESWSANADATVWTVRLRHGVMFQAPVSREVTAADVVADLRYVADPAHKCEVAYYLAPIKGADENGNASPGSLGAEALDRYTVRFTLRYPFSEFPDTLGGQAFWVWPTDYLRKVGLKAYEQHPVGTGPYQFLRRVPGASIDLVRNPHWWDTSGGPYIDTIHYEVFGNVPAMALAFQKGTVDWTTVPVGQVAASRSLPQVKSGQWKVVITPELAIRYMWVNMKDPVLGGTRGLPLRQALTYGYDRQAAIDAASGGVFLPPSTGVVPPGVPGSQDVKEPYPYDPAKAKELLQGIGPVTLELAYPVGQQQVGSVRSLISSYAKIGITIKAKGIGFDPYGDYIYGGKAQLFFGGMFADYPSMDNFLYTLFESHSTAAYPISYSNHEVDALLAKARRTADPRARVQLYAEAEQKILADAPAIPLYVFADALLLNSRVANVRFNSMFCADLWRAWVK